jgi:hypothetical protein
MKTKAEEIVLAVMAELEGRKGVFDGIDEDIMDEIKEALVKTVNL